MNYESDINLVKSLHDEFIYENQVTQKRLSEYERYIGEKRSETINPEIRTKVNEVFDAMETAVNKIIQMERLLNKNDLDSAIKFAVPNYVKEKFLYAIRENFEVFSNYIKKYCIKENSGDSAIIKGLAQCFKNVCDIRANLENYLKAYIREDEIKQNAINLQIKERDAYLNGRNEKSKLDKNNALVLIKKIKEEIKDYSDKIEAKLAFPAEPTVNNSVFDRAELIIGKAEVPNNFIDLPQFGEKIALPTTFAEEIDLNVCDNSANILIRYDEQDAEDESIYAIIENILARFVQCYPAYFKNICAMHQKVGSQLINKLGKISPKPNVKLLASGKHPGVETNPEGIRSAISNLGKILEERMSILSSGYENIIGYNAVNNDNAEPLTLVVIKDYPNGVDEQCRRNLVDIMSNGNKHGLYLVLLCNADYKDALTGLCKNEYYLSDKKLTVADKTIDAIQGNKNLTNIYYEKLHQKLKDYVSSIRFKDINDEHPVRKQSFSSCLEIPIGKEGSNKLTLNLEVRSPAAHVVIAGTSGSGKSSLLQNIVLGGAWNYSPEELHFWLMDFKDGTGFSEDTYKRLKHVKMMALKNKRKDASELLKYLSDEMHRRLEEISKSGGGDLVDYNEKQKDKGLPLMPRLVVVIDEYTQMGRMRECVEVLKNIAQQGRAAGISLIMCSQLYDDVFTETVSQANHRFEFTNNKLGRLVADCDNQDSAFLSSLIGNCLYSSEGNGMGKRRMRAAYAGKADEQEKLINIINEKYRDIKGNDTIIMGKPDFSVKPASLLVVDENAAKSEFKKSRRVISPIGETRLGGVVEYKIDAENPLLFILGDEYRAASIEYTLLKKFSAIAEDGPNVYYIDLVRSADRNLNVMTQWSKQTCKGVRFARNTDEIKDILKKLNDIYHKRVELLEAGENIGGPIELVIHSTDDLINQFKKAQDGIYVNSGVTGHSAGKYSNASDQDIYERLNGGSKSSYSESHVQKAEEVDLLSVFRELFTNGKKYRIYMMLHFSDMNAFNDSKRELFASEPNMKDAVIVPKRPDDDDIVSYQQIVDCLRAAKQSSYASLYDEQEGGLDKSEMEYAIIIDESQPTKFLPYEWSVD